MKLGPSICSLVPLLSLMVLSACPSAQPKDTAPAVDPLRQKAMLELENRIEIARLRTQLAALEEELGGSAAAGDPWAVIAHTRVQALTDADAAWNRLREIVAVMGNRGGASYWAHLGMAEIYQAWNLTDQASAEIKAAIALYPKAAPAFFARSKLADGKGPTPASRQDLVLAVSAGEGELAPIASIALSRLLQQEGKLPEAKATLAAAAHAHPAFIKLLRAQAKAETRPELRLGFLKAALALAPESLEIGKSLAEASEAMGSKDAQREALKAWTQLAQAHPSDLSSWQAVARLARNSKSLDAAEREREALSKVSELDPNELPALRRLASLRVAVDDLEGAEKALGELLVRKADDGAALLARGKVREGREALREAMADYRAAAQLKIEGATEKAAALASRVGLPTQVLSGGSPDAVYGKVARIVGKAFEKRLETTPGLGGKLSIKVWVQAGKVDEAKVQENTLHDPQLEALAYWLVVDAIFPKKKGRQAYTLPFEFESPQ